MKQFSEEELHGRSGAYYKCGENCVYEQIYEMDYDILGSNSHYKTICTKDGYDKQVLSFICKRCKERILVEEVEKPSIKVTNE